MTTTEYDYAWMGAFDRYFAVIKDITRDAGLDDVLDLFRSLRGNHSLCLSLISDGSADVSVRSHVASGIRGELGGLFWHIEVKGNTPATEALKRAYTALKAAREDYDYDREQRRIENQHLRLF